MHKIVGIPKGSKTEDSILLDMLLEEGSSVPCVLKTPDAFTFFLRKHARPGFFLGGFSSS